MSSMATSMGVEIIWGEKKGGIKRQRRSSHWTQGVNSVVCHHLPSCPIYLLFVDNVDACLDVREGVGGGQDGLAFELLVQVPVGPPIQRKGGAVDETTQVVVLVKVGDAVLHLVSVEVGLHVSDLDEGLENDGRVCFAFY